MIDVSNCSADTIKFGAWVTLIEGDTGEKRPGKLSASRKQVRTRETFR